MNSLYRYTRNLCHSGLVIVFRHHEPLRFYSKFDNLSEIEVVKDVVNREVIVIVVIVRHRSALTGNRVPS